MPIPDYQTLMLPVLRLAAEGEVKISDAVERIADQFGLSPEERAQLLPSGRQTTIANRVHWAKSYLSQGGLVENVRRGYFKASAQGLEVLSKNPDKIDNHFLMQFEAFRQFRARTRPAEPGTSPEVKPATVEPTDVTPEELIEEAITEITDNLRAQLLERIAASPPDLFERLVVDLLLKMGYGGSRDDAGRAVGGTGDGGIDGVINEDPLGLDVVYVQAKRWAPGSTVGEPEIRGFVGALLGRGASKGVFVTTSHFSPAARTYATRLQQQRIILIDGDELTRLLVKHDVAVRTDRTILLKRLDADYFEDPA